MTFWKTRCDRNAGSSIRPICRGRRIAAELTKPPPDRWDSWLFRKDGQNGDYFHNPDGKLDLDALQKSIEAQVQLGFLKQTMDIRKYTDLSLVEEAAKRLK